MLENGVEQGQEVLADFLGVRRRLPDISRILGVRRAFLPTAVARYRADRYAVAFGPAFTIVGAYVCSFPGWIRAIDIDAARIDECVEKYLHVAEVPKILSAGQILP